MAPRWVRKKPAHCYALTLSSRYRQRIKLRNAPLRTNRPSHAERVVRSTIKLLPSRATVFRNVRSRGPSSNPNTKLFPKHHRRTIPARMRSRWFQPTSTAVVRHRNIVRRITRLRVVASHRHAIFRIRKRQRENAGTRGITANRCGSDSPAHAGIAGVKHARAIRAAAREPSLPITHYDERTVARRECTFLRERRRTRLTHPMFSAVARRQNHESPIHRIA